MRLTRQSEIAISILATCARAPHRQWTTRKVAEIAGVSKDHAAQIVGLLVRGGYLKSERGRAGGLNLTVAPQLIRLGEILRLTQPRLESAADSQQPVSPAAETHFEMIVEAATASFVRFMDRFTVDDLLSGPPLGRVACFDCSLVNPSRPSMSSARSHPTQSPSALLEQNAPSLPTSTDEPKSRKRFHDHDPHPSR